MNFINYSELAGLSSEGFDKQEITSSTDSGTTTTTVYAGKSCLTDPSAATDGLNVWKIKRTVIVDDGSATTITETWAEGSWTDRASLTYKYL